MELERVKGKVFEERAGFPIQYGPERSDRQPGFPLWPHETYRDLMTIFLLTGMLFLLTAVATPPLGPSTNPNLTPFIVPDWYVLPSWGLLKFSDILQTGPATYFGCGNVCTIPGPLGPIGLDAAFWGNILTGVPFIFLLILPFIDRGRENRPAKSPVRSAFGVSFLIVFLFTTSLYSINNLILERWPFIGGDVVLQQFVIWPPILAFVASYVGLRRLGYADMYWYRIVPLFASFGIVALYSGYLGWVYSSTGFLPYATVFLVLLGAIAAIPALAVFFRSEAEALRLIKWTTPMLLIALIVFSVYLVRYDPRTWGSSIRMLAGNMHVIIALPAFSVLTAYVGLRRPYSMYEFLLNECYQCGKCHEVCPVTKVEDDALGGLNLVYNTFKKQHDGVPLWTCLACDACSAVCPLDIKYSDYILEERAKVLGMPAPDGGSPRHAR